MGERVLVLQYALDPSPSQEESLKSHVGAVRFVYNWGLSHVLENWENVKNGTTLEYVDTSMFGLRKEFNRVKDEIAPWWRENSKNAYESGLADLAVGFQNFYAKRAKLPRYKRKEYTVSESVTFTNEPRRLEEGNRHFVLPRIGKVRLHENARKLSWLLKRNSRITNCNVSYRRGRWFLSVTVRTPEGVYFGFLSHRTRKDKKKIVGIDLGIKHSIVTSDGLVVDSPYYYEKELRKLKKAQKRLSRKRKLNKKTGETPSNRYLEQKDRVAKIHAKISNQERDFTHKLTKHLVDKYEVIGLEDLNTAGMVRNRKLSRRISHAGFGRIKNYLEYKTLWYGSQLIKIDRFYPSSKTCSNCGEVKAKLPLSQRVYSCDHCKLKIDRDLNASINIRNKAAQGCGEALNGRGEKSTDSRSPKKNVSETIFYETSRLFYSLENG